MPDPLQINAGDLPHRVTLQNPAAETFDSFSQPVKTFTTLGTFWSAIWPLTGREEVIAKQVKATATHAMRTRWLGKSITVNPTTQVLFGSRIFGVVSVRNIQERNIRYEWILEEIQQTGSV